MDMDKSALHTYQLISSTEQVEGLILLPLNPTIILPTTTNVFSQIDFVMSRNYTCYNQDVEELCLKIDLNLS